MPLKHECIICRKEILPEHKILASGAERDGFQDGYRLEQGSWDFRTKEMVREEYRKAECLISLDFHREERYLPHWGFHSHIDLCEECGQGIWQAILDQREKRKP